MCTFGCSDYSDTFAIIQTTKVSCTLGEIDLRILCWTKTVAISTISGRLSPSAAKLPRPGDRSSFSMLLLVFSYSSLRSHNYRMLEALCCRATAARFFLSSFFNLFIGFCYESLEVRSISRCLSPSAAKKKRPYVRM